jgi:shikimate dehydrogenase
MLRFAVVGSPVAHSKSPIIHALFARQTGVNLKYNTEEVCAQNFDNFVIQFFAGGGAGLNVTLPHKERAKEIALNLEPLAKRAGAVNTLFVNSRQEICGDNTDGPGLIADIKVNNGVNIGGQDVLLLGAGGAIRGVLAPLINEGPSSVTIVNRTISKAALLKKEFSETLDIQIANYESLKGSFDLIINGTSSGITGGVPPLREENICTNTYCYDMMYGDKETDFITWVKSKGVRNTADGLGMLVEQAAESFFRWHGLRPNTTDVVRELRAS